MSASPCLGARRSHLFFARLFGPGVEPGYMPIHLPKLHTATVDEPPGGFDGGLIINTIQLNQDWVSGHMLITYLSQKRWRGTCRASGVDKLTKSKGKQKALR
jgi:hypothetical protein